MPPVRTRLALALVSLGLIALELALMRALALRFWHHFAAMVIGVALLGFGASGTALTLARRWVAPRLRECAAALLLVCAGSIPLCLAAVRAIPLDIPFLAWDFSQAGWVAAMEGCLLVPFLFGGAAVGVALMDAPRRVGGHYAANLVGSGAGAVAAVLLFHVLRPGEMVLATALVCLAAALTLVPWSRIGWAAAATAFGAALVLAVWFTPADIPLSPYKTLPQALAAPGSEVLARADGPLGRLDVVAGPALHHAPGLSLQYGGPVPPHVLLVLDGDQVSPVFDCPRLADWEFLDWTTGASAYHLRPGARVLVIGAGGGADVGLALYHRSRQVVALEMNRQVIDLMRGPLADRGGAVLDAPAVRTRCAEARGFLESSRETFDLVQIPPLDAFGASGAGLYAAQESYLYTVEAFQAALACLSDEGILSVTRWVRVPPRDGLKVFDTAAEALRRWGLDPAPRLAMIRSWATVTVLASRTPFGPGVVDALRAFAAERGFDLCYGPGVRADEVNRWHVLDRPYFYEGARALLGPERAAYLARYPFAVAAATDERPYFFHFFRWRSLPILQAQLGRRARAFLEVGYLMLLGALAQTVVLAGVLILGPLAPGAAALRRAPRRGAALAYFLFIGVGFMLLEIAFLQRLVLYLAHPIYSSAVVIAAFLVFAGVGSSVSRRWPFEARHVAAGAGIAVGVLALLTAAASGGLLRPTQGWPMWAKMAVAAASIAPLAFAMGHMMPTGLRLAGAAAPILVPWAWGVNGFASVAATVAAPLAAMAMGFSWVVAVAAGCYVLAALAALGLGRRQVSPAPL